MRKEGNEVINPLACSFLLLIKPSHRSFSPYHHPPPLLFLCATRDEKAKFQGAKLMGGQTSKRGLDKSGAPTDHKES